MGNQKKVLLIWPRIHVNFIPVINSFLLHDYKVNVIVNQTGLGYNSVDQDILYLKEYFLNSNGEPNENKIIQYCKLFDPDIVFIRTTDYDKNFNSIIKTVAKQHKVICYDQSRCSFKLSIKFILEEIRLYLFRRELGLPNVVLTPITNQNSFRGFRLPYKHSFHTPIDPVEEYPKNKVGSIIKIIMVGKFRKSYKRHDWLLKSVFEFDKFNLNITLIGQAIDSRNKPKKNEIQYFNKIKKLVEQIHNETNHKVSFIYDVNPADMHHYYRSNDIYVLASLSEGFGFSPLEAMMAKCAVIVPSDNGSTCYIENNFNGIVFNSRSYDDFKEKLFNTICNKDIVQYIQNNGYNYVTKNHSYNRFVDKFEKIGFS